MAKRITSKNRKAWAFAKRYLVGGVDSPARAFGPIGADPVLVERGKGSKIFDIDGNEYIDYLLSWGSMILGHGSPEVVASVRRAAGDGFSFGTTNRREVELAAMISRAIPFAQKTRFVNSGTEAVMGAVRLARGFTGRDKIVKFENAYHGHADHLLAKAGSGLATLGLPTSAGVPKDITKHTIVTPYNDIDAIENIFIRHGSNIAAVLVEPVGGNYGVVIPDLKFIKRLKELTKTYGALLIFDEVITGFRFAFGSVSKILGVEPDLITLGKIIGGGFPAGAYAGRREIMDHLAPIGDVYQASTFAGNPITMNAGLATLKILERSGSGYVRIEELALHLVSGIEEAASEHGVILNVERYMNMFSVKFSDNSIFARFYTEMLNRGIYFAPSEFESNFLSFAHTKKDIDKTIAAVRSALERIGR